MLKSIRNLSDFRAATGHFEVIVDVEKDTRFVPDKLKGERILFVAVGDVDAGVDFSGLKDDAVVVSDDRRSVTLELPPARYNEPSSTSSEATSTTATAASSTASSRSSATTWAPIRRSTRSRRTSSPPPRAADPACASGPSETRA